MIERSSGIDPEKLSNSVIKKTFGEIDPGKDARIPVYRVRWWGYTEKWRANTFVIDVLGCNEDCAHCYVPVPLLRGNIKSEEFEAKFQKLPRYLQEFPQPADKLFKYAFNRFKKKYGSAKNGVIEFNGGEPTLYPAAIKKMAELCRDERLTLGINTNGFIIATQDEFLKGLAGFEDTISFMVSIKGTSPEEFRRFSGAEGKHYLTPFEAARRIQNAGFRPARLGVTVDTIALPGTVDHDIQKLSDLLHQYDLDPQLLVLDKITEKIFNYEFPTVHKMIERGYYERLDGNLIRHTDPGAVTSRLRKSLMVK